MIETLARGKSVPNPADLQWLKVHTRIATEQGADIIKTNYTGTAEGMREVVDSCQPPILVLEGSRNDSAMDAGAAGVFFGRNVFQSDEMPGLLREARTVLDGSRG